jgi:hypothetical protein
MEAKADFKIEFEGGSSATLCLADPDSSVAVALTIAAPGHILLGAR